MKVKQFIRYNKIVLITFVIAYAFIVFFVDILHFKAWLVVLIVSGITHFVRYFYLFEKNDKIKNLD